MRKLFLFFIPLFFVTGLASAKIRRVGFFASPVAGTDYTTFDLANTAAAAGDTILMFPSTSINATLTKKLKIFGPGYWLDPASTPAKGNAGLQAFAGVSTMNNLTFNTGSEGSVLMGMSGGTIFINTSDITIQRNYNIVIYLAFLNAVVNVNNLQVLQNYRVNIANYYTNGSTYSNMNISNNFIYSFAVANGNTYSGSISNNVWAFDQTQSANDLNGGANTLSYAGGINLGGGAFLVQNNIFAYYSNAGSVNNGVYSISNQGNSIFNYNLSVQGSVAIAWGTGVGNVITPIANTANIFQGFPLIGSRTADDRYRLKAGSPALVANRPGSSVDAGMYAGSYPYKLSGIPTIPSIYALSSPQGNNPSGSTIQINVSTRGNN